MVVPCTAGHLDDDGRAVVVLIRTVSETGSTNADMLALVASGIAEGVWLRAERQTAGRGRQGREWSSPSGNLHTSTVVYLRPADPPAATLALVAALALHGAAATFLPPGTPLTIKWPNDLLLDGAKLAGILLERSGNAVVIGCGANLAEAPVVPGRATTSMATHAAPVQPESFIEVLADAFARWLSRWRGEGLAPVRTRWLALAHPPGAALNVRLPDGTCMTGLFEGLDRDGALLIQTKGGRTTVHAGDVFLL